MHHFIPFNSISGNWLNSWPCVVISVPIRAAYTGQQLHAMSPCSPGSYSWVCYCTSQPAQILSAPLPCAAKWLPHVLPQKEWVTRILRLKSVVLSVLLGANTDQSLLLGFPLSCDCSNVQVVLCSPVIPELLRNILSRESPSNPCSFSLSSFSLPLSPTTPFPFLWFPLSFFYM